MITFRLRSGTDGAAGLTCGMMLLRFFSGPSNVLELSLAFRASAEVQFGRV